MKHIVLMRGWETTHGNGEEIGRKSNIGKKPAEITAKDACLFNATVHI